MNTSSAAKLSSYPSHVIPGKLFHHTVLWFLRSHNVSNEGTYLPGVAVRIKGTKQCKVLRIGPVLYRHTVYKC